jgi:hypothetical protein
MTGCGDSWTKVKSYVGVKESTPEDKEKVALQCRQADDLVAKWTENLSSKGPQNNGFIQHEGITEPDPWGNFIKVNYKQEGFTEILTVASCGPDGVYNTNDDIVRHRSTNTSLWSGISYYLFGPFGFIILAWIICTGLVLLLDNRKKKELNVARVALIVLAAPFVLFFYFIMILASLIGDGDGIDIDL